MYLSQELYSKCLEDVPSFKFFIAPGPGHIFKPHKWCIWETVISVYISLYKSHM